MTGAEFRNRVQQIEQELVTSEISKKLEKAKEERREFNKNCKHDFGISQADWQKKVESSEYKGHSATCSLCNLVVNVSVNPIHPMPGETRYIYTTKGS